MHTTGHSILLSACSKTYGDGLRVVDAIDLSVGAGEKLSILGPSGCGKTTTLRMIAGLEAPDYGGRVMFDRTDVTGTSVNKRNVGVVFQNYALFPNMTVEENVGYGLRVRKWSRGDIAERVNETMDMLRITQFAKRPITKLSGGQKQRVALARALAVRPMVLLMDEPLTALDESLREAVRSEIDSLLRELGITTVYVTHDQGEAMTLGDRIAVMNSGKIAQIGTPREIYNFPSSVFVADFVGTLNRLVSPLSWTNANLPAVDSQGKTIGKAATIFFRPEAASIDSSSQLIGTVRSSCFLGDRVRLTVDLPGENPITLNVAGHGGFNVGQSIAIRINHENTFTL